MGHHYVPQQYLKGFEASDEPGAIWTYDKKTHRFARIPIRVVAQEAGYYDPEIEEELSKLVEGPGHSSLAKLRRHESLSGDDRLRLAMYVATMMMRVPRRHRKASELMPSVLNGVIDEVRSRIEEWAKRPDVDQELVARRLAEVEHAHRKVSQDPPTEVVEQIRSPWPSEKVVGLVHGMTWRIAMSNGENRFLTSDNPAYFFEGYGLGAPEAEITFPLASDIALLASWQGVPRSVISVQAWPELVKEVNRRVASGAERFVFYDERRDWVATVSEKPNPFLRRISWQLEGETREA